MAFRTLGFLFLLLSVSCSSVKTEEPTSSIQIYFSPSFMPSSSLKIKGDVMSFEVSSFSTDTVKTVYAQTYKLNSNDIKLIESGFQKFGQEYEEKERLPGTDGITVNVISKLLVGNDTLRFWSPRRETQS